MSDPEAQKMWPQLFVFYKALLSSNLSTTARMVALVLLVHIDQKGKCWVSLPTIARKAGCSASAASRALEKLFDGGWLVRTAGGTGRDTSRYQLEVPENKPDDEYKEFMRARIHPEGRHTSYPGYAEEQPRVRTEPTQGGTTAQAGCAQRLPELPIGTTPGTTPLTDSRASALDAMHPEEIKPEELAEALPDYALGFGYYLGDPDPCPDPDLFTHWVRFRSEAPDEAVGCMMSFAEAKKYELEGAS